LSGVQADDTAVQKILDKKRQEEKEQKKVECDRLLELHKLREQQQQQQLQQQQKAKPTSSWVNYTQNGVKPSSGVSKTYLAAGVIVAVLLVWLVRYSNFDLTQISSFFHLSRS